MKANTPSDPYLMTAYDKKSLSITADKNVTITIEIDLTGDGHWTTYTTSEITAKDTFEHTFPDHFSAYWIRFRCDHDATATATLLYR